MTELIEPAGRVELAERNLIENRVKELISNSKRLEGIALCGTLPPGITGSIYSLIATMKPRGCVVLLDAYQNIECLNTGKVDVLKINTEEARKLVNEYPKFTRHGDEDDWTVPELGKWILMRYKLPLLAITDGPGSAFLFERKDTKVAITRYFLPPLEQAIHDIDLSSMSPISVSSSLPEATGDAFTARVGSSLNLAAMGLSPQRLLLNPLGAGDTCSAIFLVEYLDTKVLIINVECYHFLSAWISSCQRQLLRSGQYVAF
jgi:fructose-1-phosphate kinase PfkB-like protein